MSNPAFTNLALTGVFTSTQAAQLQNNVLVSFLGPFQNLYIKNNATTPASKVDVTADLLYAGSAVLTSFSGTVDLTVNGLNGLDTGTKAISTWYYLFAVSYVDVNGTTFSGLLASLSRTAPTLPANYTGFKWIGCLRTDGPGNLLLFRQVDREVWYEIDNGSTTQSGVLLVNAGTATTFTLVNCNIGLPPPALFFKGLISSASSTYTRPTGSSMANGNVNGSGNQIPIIVHTNSSQQIDYKVSSGSTIISITSYYLPI